MSSVCKAMLHAKYTVPVCQAVRTNMQQLRPLADWHGVWQDAAQAAHGSWTS